AMVFAVIVSIPYVATAEPHPCAVRADVVAASDTLAEVAGRRLRLDACRDRCVAEVRACRGSYACEHPPSCGESKRVELPARMSGVTRRVVRVRREAGEPGFRRLVVSCR